MLKLQDGKVASGFYFNGICSLRYGVEIVTSSGGLSPLPFIGGQSIDQQAPLSGIVPHLLGTTKEPMEFELELAVIGQKLTQEKRMELAAWLIQPRYCPLELCNNRGIIYHVMVTSQADFLCNANQEGYYRLALQAMPTSYTTRMLQSFDLGDYQKDGAHYQTPALPARMDVYNPCNAAPYYLPSFTITCLENMQTVQIENLSYQQTPFIIQNAEKNAIFHVDGRLRTITRTINGETANCFDQCNKQWLKLCYGSNILQVGQRIQIDFENEFPIYA